MKYLYLSIFFIFLISSCNPQINKIIISSENAPKAIGPYSQAVLAGNTLYLSGQIAINPLTGNMVTDNIENETKQVMTNLEAVLKQAGFEFKNVVSTTIYVTDMENYKKVNEIYASYFTSDFPARATVQVAKLPKNANVEISMIASK